MTIVMSQKLALLQIALEFRWSKGRLLGNKKKEQFLAGLMTV